MITFFKHFPKSILLFFCTIYIMSCSGLSPIYKYEDDKKIREVISNMIVLPVEGRYGTVLSNELRETFGSKNNSGAVSVYKLKSSVSVGSSSAQAYNDDGTASRFRLSVSVAYQLYDEKNCHVFSGSNSTKASFNSKSGGYDYGNIASERFAVIRNIEYNVINYYPQIYNAIKNKKASLPFVPPFLSIKNFKGCRG